MRKPRQHLPNIAHAVTFRASLVYRKRKVTIPDIPRSPSPLRCRLIPTTGQPRRRASTARNKPTALSSASPASFASLASGWFFLKNFCLPAAANPQSNPAFSTACHIPSENLGYGIPLIAHRLRRHFKPNHRFDFRPPKSGLSDPKNQRRLLPLRPELIAV